MSIASKFDLSRISMPGFDKAFSRIMEYSYPYMSKEEAHRFLNPSLKDIADPSLFKHMDEAIELFMKHFKAGNRIMICGDYDVDGVTSVALWIRFFEYMGYTNREFFVPNRFKHGYGLSPAAVEHIIRQQPALLITVDNGINAGSVVDTLRDAGIETIITDHHTPVNKELANCPIINPKIPGCLFPEKDIAGVGVAFMFLTALRRELRKQGYWNEVRPEPNMVSDLDLVALGTVADQAPLYGLNRVFVHYGLRQIESGKHSNRPEFYSYINSLFSTFPNYNHYNIDNDFLSYKISPLLNAAGRLEDGMIAVSFITSLSQSEADTRLKQLIELNQKRHNLQVKMLDIAYIQAHQQKNSGGLLIYSPDFHEGITGLIAGKLSDEFKLPCIVLADMGSEDNLKGSCRIPEGGSILNILKACSEYLENYGGHHAAAGCVINRSSVENFRKLYKQASLMENTAMPVSNYMADYQVSPDFLSIDFYDRLKSLEPHGNGNPRPIFLLNNFNFNTKPVRGKNF
ncbi:hypothetical protein CHS0354_027414 [Potamilus streckersoni]|uniref:Single-stranded-DNA-specific exonuclease RecJ n=1 Tax=Potamilus streckersoni TaxID=2493646 RepID=A0AAE0W017_9BIVA|nr:hypothetical protein CHS0354_027414 [Potamilus streckersoni]